MRGRRPDQFRSMLNDRWHLCPLWRAQILQLGPSTVLNAERAELQRLAPAERQPLRPIITKWEQAVKEKPEALERDTILRYDEKVERYRTSAVAAVRDAVRLCPLLKKLATSDACYGSFTPSARRRASPAARLASARRTHDIRIYRGTMLNINRERTAHQFRPWAVPTTMCRGAALASLLPCACAFSVPFGALSSSGSGGTMSERSWWSGSKHTRGL
jgi:hypothetical protein